jgi:hypothetical protein
METALHTTFGVFRRRVWRSWGRVQVVGMRGIGGRCLF